MQKFIRPLVLCLLSAALFVLSQQPLTAQSSPGLYRIDATTSQDLLELFTPNSCPLPLVSAHRGGAALNWPENCLETFEETLRHAWSMLEIDLRYTKDGVLVLNHDPTLDRTSNGHGQVIDHTLKEIQQLQLKDRAGNLTAYRIPTLDAVIEWARGKTVLVLDKKNVPVRDCVKKIEEHNAEAWVMIMASNYNDIQEVYTLNSDIMFEVMIGDSERFEGFDKIGVPWRNIIAFVGHTPTPDPDLCKKIHARGASTMAGTSRNFDREFLSGRVTDMGVLKPDYLGMLNTGVDVIETDIPREVGPLLFGGKPVPSSMVKYLHAGSR